MTTEYNKKKIEKFLKRSGFSKEQTETCQRHACVEDFRNPLPPKASDEQIAERADSVANYCAQRYGWSSRPEE